MRRAIFGMSSEICRPGTEVGRVPNGPPVALPGLRSRFKLTGTASLKPESHCAPLPWVLSEVPGSKDVQASIAYQAAGARQTDGQTVHEKPSAHAMLSAQRMGGIL